MSIRPALSLIICMFLTGWININAKCPKPERLVEDDAWCVDDHVVPNYIFDARDPSLQIKTKSNGTFKINLHDVRTAVEKELKDGETRAEILGYGPYSSRDPHRATIFVNTKERKEILDWEIEKTKKRFKDRCFHCVLSGKPDNNKD